MTAARKIAPNDAPHLTIAGSPDPTVEYIDVAPELAEEWLGKNPKNRRTKPAKISQFTRSMQRGEWRMTGEALKFDTLGNLLDGQNRLAAVIASRKTVRFCVMRGLLPEAQDVMDTGAARTIGDQLTIHGHANATTAGATAGLLVLWYSGRFNAERAQQAISHAEVLEFAYGNASLAHAVAEAGRFRNLIKARPSAVAAAYYLMMQVDVDDAQEFIARVADGANLPVGSPILALRHRLQVAADDRSRLAGHIYCSLLIRAWNYWRSDTKVSQLNVFSRTGPIPCPVPK